MIDREDEEKQAKPAAAVVFQSVLSRVHFLFNNFFLLTGQQADSQMLKGWHNTEEWQPVTVLTC